MANPNGRKGTDWENAIVEALKGAGFPFVERRAKHGSKDRGDIAGLPGWVIEAKNEKKQDLAGWLGELAVEMVNDGARHGVVWAKRRGRASALDGYVVMTGGMFMKLLAELEGL